MQQRHGAAANSHLKSNTVGELAGAPGSALLGWKRAAIHEDNDGDSDSDSDASDASAFSITSERD